ncbi:hypothetical protein BGW38_009434, partial [Lunasporangiospora selenospora]
MGREGVRVGRFSQSGYDQRIIAKSSGYREMDQADLRSKRLPVLLNKGLDQEIAAW